MNRNHELLKKGFTSEDVKSIMGLTLEKSLLEIYEEKAGDYQYEESFKEKKANALLPLALEYYSKSSGVNGVLAKPYLRDGKIATMSGLGVSPLRPKPAADQNGFVQLISPSISKWADRIVNVEFPPAFPAKDWPENGTTIKPRSPGAFPYTYIVRCVWDMAVTGIKKCDLMVMIDEHFMIYTVEYDEFFADAVLASADAFSKNHLIPKVRPVSGDPLVTYESLLLKNEKQETDGMLEATTEDASLAMNYETFAAIVRENEHSMYDIRNKLCEKIGSARGISGICVWEQQDKIDYEKLVNYLIAEAFVKETDVVQASSMFRKTVRNFRFLNES
jgi:hypothetical protein